MVTPLPLPTDASGPLPRPTAARPHPGTYPGTHPAAHRPATRSWNTAAVRPAHPQRSEGERSEGERSEGERSEGERSEGERWVDPAARVERVQLDGRCWVDVVRGLVPDADRAHHEVLRSTPWRQGRSFRYERWVDDTRLSATVSGPRRHAALAEVETWLVRRYRVRFSGVVLTRYRDARESLGFHRDTGLTWLDDTLVAVFTLGARRPWCLRPDTGRQRFSDDDEWRDVVDLAPTGGDLIVMGGACQRDWLHAVPPTTVAVGERVSAQWRWTSRRGEPDQSLRHRDAWRFTSPR